MSAMDAEDGHDAIVRRLLAARTDAAPVTSDISPDAPSSDELASDELAEIARRATADIVPALAAFSGPVLPWRVDGVRTGPWGAVEGAALVSTLSREGRTAALVSCDAAFLSALMVALFGATSTARRDPTATELCVFAQLVVRLRDALDPSLDHAPPEVPDGGLEPPAGEAVIVNLVAGSKGAGGRGGGGKGGGGKGAGGESGGGEEVEDRLSVAMAPGVARDLLPSAAARPRTATPAPMRRLPLAAEIGLAGPSMRLADIAALRVGVTLASRDDRPTLVVEHREVATGRLRGGPRRALVIERRTNTEGSPA